ncbi:beclin 1 [Ascoidea rubescens DSM 1968]|uniref:APG6-domain-containing protein n=1 Tax=Ascoidea rubescens DSM 1968 TaxID=1344418 RepID=A0A1D2VL72_9ASCO|nr:APG6-domain-containing protein [Ascoidea rubescens DSM 1968]ODV62353.1 APG6-domain-containing protein [Ascoidea rubescens DSM 1968]
MHLWAMTSYHSSHTASQHDAQLDMFKCHSCKLPINIHPTLLNLSNAHQNILLNGLANSYSDNGDDSDNHHSLYYFGLESDDDSTTNQNEMDPEIYSNTFKLQDDRFETFTLAMGHTSENYLEQQTLNMDNFEINSPIQIHNAKTGQNDSNLLSTNFNSNNSLIKIFNKLSLNSDIDYPICNNCSKSIISNFNNQLSELNSDKLSYINFYRTLTSKNMHNTNDNNYDNNNIENDGGQSNFDNKINQVINEYDDLNNKYIQLMNELQNYELQTQKVDNEIANILDQLSTLNSVELDLLKFKNLFFLRILNSFNKKNFINQILLNKKMTLNKLIKTNVFNDIFNISHNNYKFAVINGFRLGNIKSDKVQWFEINCAMGEVVHLLYFIINYLNLSTGPYLLKPLGSFSVIEIDNVNNNSNGHANTSDNNEILSCYSSGNSQFERLLIYKKFDASLVTILHIILLILKELQKFKPNFNGNIRGSASNSNEIDENDVNINNNNSNNSNNSFNFQNKLPYKIEIYESKKKQNKISSGDPSFNNLNNSNELDFRFNSPYHLSGEIGGISIKLGSKLYDEEWTMGCKFLLTDLKYILACASKIILNGN